MLEYIDRLKETINVFFDNNAVATAKKALVRISSGEYLTKEDMVFD